MKKIINNPTDVMSKEDLEDYLKGILNLNEIRNTGDYWKHIIGLDNFKIDKIDKRNDKL